MTRELYEARLAEGSARSWINSGLGNIIEHVRRYGGAPGDVVECGSYKGGSAMVIAAALAYFFPRDEKTVFAFDSFSGFPRLDERDGHDFPTFSDTSFEEVRSATEHIANLSLVPGDFRETLPTFPDRPIAILHLDADLYESTKICLEKFFPMVSSGGIVLLDDYRGLPGATAAIDEFLGGNAPVNHAGLHVVAGISDCAGATS